MASNKNITMRQFNGTDYDYLYPKTTTGQVSGLSDNYYSKSESNGLYLKTDGSNVMNGNINVNNHYVTGVLTGINGTDAASKDYVDNTIASSLAGTWKEFNTVNYSYSYSNQQNAPPTSAAIIPTGINIQNIKRLRITVQFGVFTWVGGWKYSGDTTSSYMSFSPFGPQYSNYSNRTETHTNEYTLNEPVLTGIAYISGTYRFWFAGGDSNSSQFFLSTNNSYVVTSVSAPSYPNNVSFSGAANVQNGTNINAIIKVYGLF